MVVGRVIDDSTGRGVAGVGVSVTLGCIIPTNAQGAYAIGPLAPGEYRVTVHSDWYYQWRKPLLYLRSDTVAVHDIHVAPMQHCADSGPGARVSGIIVDDSTGKPVEGAQVSVQETQCGAITASDGRFSIIGLPAGQRTLIVRRIGYAMVQLPHEIPVGRATEIRVRMRAVPTRMFVYHVPDVGVVPPDSARSPAGPRPAVGPDSSDSSEISVSDIRVRRTRCADARPLAHLSALVVDDSTGHPVRGAQAGLSSTDCGALTDADGRLAIVVPAGKHRLSVRLIGYSPTTIQVHLPVGRTTELTVRMRRAGTVTLDGPPPHGP